jgi:hypothetical protein
MGGNPILMGQRDSKPYHVEVNYQSEAGNRAQSETSSVEATSRASREPTWLAEANLPKKRPTPYHLKPMLA